MVESVSLTSCSVEGGEELLLAGTNFLSLSRVLFMERGTDGKLQWEEEARVDRDHSNECLLCVRVPAYSDVSVSRPVPVCLYVSNGKRKRSSTHCFKYLPIMFKEEDPLLSRPSALNVEGVSLFPMGGPSTPDRGLHSRADPLPDDRGLRFLLPPHPSAYQSYHEDYSSKPETSEDSGGSKGPLSESHPNFDSLELGFTELLPPLYPRAPQPPSSPSPWLDSPYLSSSPSPSHSSSLSPFPTGSPIPSSPLPPVSNSPYPQCYSQEVCPSPPSNPSPYQDFYHPLSLIHI